MDNSIGSKFNLTKKVSKPNNKINIGKNIKNNNMKYFNPKFTSLNCFNNNIINKQRGLNDIKNIVKNKTFEIENINSNIINKINNTKESCKIYHKNKIMNHSNHLKGNNQIIIKKIIWLIL